MDFTSTPSLKSRKAADLLVIPFWKGSQCPEPCLDINTLKILIKDSLATEDFHGKEGELIILYVSGQPEKRIALLGLGIKDELTVEKIRRAYASVTKESLKKKLKKINLLVPECGALKEEEIILGMSEGLLLPNYNFTTLKHEALENNPSVLLEVASFIGLTKPLLTLAKKSATICEAVYFARDLVNGNADDVTPQYLAAVARGLEKTLTEVKTTVFDKKRIEKEKLDLLLAVNRGSNLEPTFIIVEYTGNKKSKDKTVIVGKGVTYDTGGLFIKPRGSMETMKDDMSGAATALGVILAVATLEMSINLTVVIPSTENSIGSKSYKPGDVYSSYLGKTVEIGDTDAEGRLILADALAYAVKNLKPSRIIDIATLTGSVIMALGEEASGLMSNNDVLVELLTRAGSETFERLWRMPLYEEYKDQLKSDIADIRNIGGRSAGSITAAMFLQEFVGKTPWAHIDIAGTAFLSDVKRYTPKHGTGVGVRLFVSFLENFTSL